MHLSHMSNTHTHTHIRNVAHTRTHSQLAEHGTLLMSKGNYGGALVTYDRCLSIQLQHLGDMHPIVAHTVDLMGVALLRIGSAAEVRHIYVHTYIYTYIYIHIFIHTHAHTHT